MKLKAISMAIAFLFIASGLIIFMNPSASTEAASYTTTWGYLPGHSGDMNYTYITNGLVVFSANKYFVNLNSTDGLAQWTKIEAFYGNNGTNTETRLGGDNTIAGYIYTFTDAIGSGVQYQWKVTRVQTPNSQSSFYFKVYDGLSFITWHWEAKNILSWPINITGGGYLYCNQVFNALSGMKVGLVTNDIYSWNPNSYTTFFKNPASLLSFSLDGMEDFPAVGLFSKSSQKSIILGPLTQVWGGGSIQLDATVSPTALYGINKAYMSLDQQSQGGYTLQNIRLATGANFTSDIGFVGFSNTNDATQALDDYLRAMLSLNTFKSETLPYEDGIAYDTWTYYTININDTLIRTLADQLVLHYPSIKWLNINYGWQDKAFTANEGDCLDLDVNLTRFPDMADTVDYIHSKGLKTALWVATGIMNANGAMYANHPTWTLKYASNGSAIVGHPFQSNVYYADPSNLEYRIYLETQLQTMRTTWGFDGFEFDLEPRADSGDRMSNYNISLIRGQYLYELAIKNATWICEYVNAFTPLKGNPLACFAQNLIYPGTDTFTFTSFKSNVLNWTLSYMVPTSSRVSSFPIANLGALTEGLSEANTIAMADFFSASMTLTHLSFSATYNQTFHDAVAPLLEGSDLTGTRYIQGQNPTDNNKQPNVFARAHSLASTTIPDITMAIINWGATPVSISESWSSYGLPSAGRMHVLDYRSGNRFSSLTLEVEMTGGDSRLFEIMVLYSPALVHLGAIIGIMMTLGVLVSILVPVVQVAQEKRKFKVDDLIQMVIYIVVSVSLIGLVYALLP